MPVFAKAQEKPKAAPAGRPPAWNYSAPGQRGAIRSVLLGFGVQAKLKVSHPQDAAELEADRIAEKISRMPLPATGDPASPPGKSTSSPGPASSPSLLPPLSKSPSASLPSPSPVSASVRRESVSRACDECEEEVDTLVHASRESGAEFDIPDDWATGIAAFRTGGRPLPPIVRADMENRFGRDFSSVRIHTGSDAAAAAHALHAHAFTLGDHIAFGEGAFQPEGMEGRKLLAHELTHVAQQGGAALRSTQPSQNATDGRVYRDEEPGFFESIVNWGRDQVFSLVRSHAPGLEPILREGPFEWLKRQLGSAFSAIADRVRSLLPAGAVEQLHATFGPLVERASQIVTALASGDCAPLLQAIDDVRTFVTEIAGQAWDKLADTVRPIGDFFSDLWNGYGAPAVEWLRQFAGDVWNTITQLGQDIWDWTQPIRDGFSSAWTWIKESLFGPEDESAGASPGGIVGWVTTKAGEAWNWVKEQARPVWEPVSQAVETVTSLIPPPFIRSLGESFQDLGAQLQSAGSEIGTEGDEVASNREALAAALPSVQQVLAMARGGILSAKTWILDTMGDLTSRFNGFLANLRSIGILAPLSSAISWLGDIGTGLSAWAQEKVAGLFDFAVQAFDAVSPFIEKIAGLVQQIISVASDILQLPGVILGSIWNAIPECIRNPVKDFFLNQILSRIPVFSSLAALPEMWARLEAVALRILRQVFVDGNLAGAAWTFFSNMLALVGIPPELVVSILAKAATAVGDILTNPIGFVVTMVTGIGNGFLQFLGNIGTHLLNGITGWLFGALEGAGITVPTDFTLRGILGFVMDVLGITLDNIFDRLGRRISPAIVAALRRAVEIATGVWEWISVLITEGPAGLWRLVQERLSNLWSMVLDSAMGWITQRVVTQATIWLGSLVDISGITPAINTLIAMYRAMQSAVEYLVPILRIVDLGLDGIGAMARGDPAPAANFVEQALGRGMPVAIGFLAAQLGLGGISGRIREIVDGARESVNDGIDWLIDRALAGGQALIDMVRRGAAAVTGGIASLREWWRNRKRFRSANGEDHSLYFTGTGTSARLMVASDPAPYSTFIAGINPGTDAAKRTAKTEALRIARELETAIHAAPSAAPTGSSPAPTRRDSGLGAGGASLAADPSVAINDLLDSLAIQTAIFMPAETASGRSSRPIYGPLVNGFGSSVRVERLANDLRSEGSPASSSLSNDTYRLIDARKDGGRAYYCRGHLMNNRLGGPGNTWDNLTPLAQYDNNPRFLNALERPVIASLTNPSCSINFIVTAQYNRPRYSRRDNSALERIKEAESITPSHLAYSATALPGSTCAGLPNPDTLTLANPTPLTPANVGSALNAVKYQDLVDRYE